MRRLWEVAVLVGGLSFMGCSQRTAPREDASVPREAPLLAECPGGTVQGCIEQADALSAPNAAPRDDARALHLYGVACELKNAQGCLRAGQMVDEGKVEKRDPQKALALFRKGCTLEHKTACSYVTMLEKMEELRNLGRRRAPVEEGVPPGRTPTHAELQGTWGVDCERTALLQPGFETEADRARFKELCVNAAQRYVITQDTLEMHGTVKGKPDVRTLSYTYEDGDLRAVLTKSKVSVTIPAELRGDTLLLMDGFAGGATALERL